MMQVITRLLFSLRSAVKPSWRLLDRRRTRSNSIGYSIDSNMETSDRPSASVTSGLPSPYGAEPRLACLDDSGNTVGQNARPSATDYCAGTATH